MKNRKAQGQQKTFTQQQQENHTKYQLTPKKKKKTGSKARREVAHLSHCHSHLYSRWQEDSTRTDAPDKTVVEVLVFEHASGHNVVVADSGAVCVETASFNAAHTEENKGPLKHGQGYEQHSNWHVHDCTCRSRIQITLA